MRVACPSRRGLLRPKSSPFSVKTKAQIRPDGSVPGSVTSYSNQGDGEKPGFGDGSKEPETKPKAVLFKAGEQGRGVVPGCKSGQRGSGVRFWLSFNVAGAGSLLVVTQAAGTYQSRVSVN